MNSEDLTLKALNSTLAGTIQNIINESCIMEYGIIKKVLAKGVVTVAVSVANSEKDIRIITCILANTASKALTVNIEPVEGDKVLVVFPRRYNEEMFNVDKSDIILDENAIGFSMLTGIAILCNQYKLNSHENVISAAQNGDINIKNNKTTIDIKSNGEITIDSTAAKIMIETSGNISLDAKGGKLALKNTATSLKDVLDSILTHLISAKTADLKPFSPDTIAALGTDKTSLATILS